MPSTKRCQLPAVCGGEPVRSSMLPIARPSIDEADIAAVVDTLRSGWLATGPRTATFEQRFADYVGARHAVAVTSGTAALELALEVAGVGPGDEVVTSPLTFAATAHAIVRRGADPVLADIDPRTWNLDANRVDDCMTPRTKAILPVHFAGRPCDMNRLEAIAGKHDVLLISDAAHAIETRYDGRGLAGLAAATAYSFHPVKNLTTGEGGMIVTDHDEWVPRLRQLRFHGLTSDAWTRDRRGINVDDDVLLPGLKCNMSDLQACLGLGQLARLDQRHEQRERLWRIYDQGLVDLPGISTPVPVASTQRHARHMYNVLVDPERLAIDRRGFRAALKAENIATGHHYPSLHRTTYYAQRCGLTDADLPHSSFVTDRIVTLPLHPAMTDEDAGTVVDAVGKIVEHYG